MILLALLVSFVTSMATGIVTVSLMDQAPPSVTQTINRVVERTVERVVSAPASVASSNNSNKETVVTKETVVVRDDDMVIASVEKNRKFVFRVMKIRTESGVVKEKFGGLAVPIDSKGLLVADIFAIQKKYDDFGTIIPESYKVVGADGSSFAVVPVGADETNGLVFFEPRDDEGRPMPGAFKGGFVTFGDSGKLKLGQSVVALGGYASDTVSTGIVSALAVAKDSAEGDGNYVSIKTDIRDENAVSGTILLNLSGEVVGFLGGRVGDGSTFMPSRILMGALERIQKSGHTGLPF